MVVNSNSNKVTVPFEDAGGDLDINGRFSGHELAEILNGSMRSELLSIAYQNVRNRPDARNLAEDLVQEVYVRLLTQNSDFDINDSEHALNCGLMLLRRVVVDHCRFEDTLKRGGGASRLSLDQSESYAARDRSAESFPKQMAEIADFLDSLPDKDQSVLRGRLGGSTVTEIAGNLNLSKRSVEYSITALRNGDYNSDLSL